MEDQYVTSRKRLFIEDWAWDEARDGPAPEFINDMVGGQMLRGAWTDVALSDERCTRVGTITRQLMYRSSTSTRDVHNTGTIIDDW